MVIKSEHFLIEKKEWESNFFKRSWGTLKFTSDFSSDSFHKAELGITRDLTGILDQSDRIFNLLEFIVTTQQFYITPVIEDCEFRLVDTRISFKTLFDFTTSTQNFNILPPLIKIIKYSPKYLNSILKLTEKYIVENPEFTSRFKNRRFLGDKDARAYFREWIKNSLLSEQSISCVLVDEDEVVNGYFIYEQTEFQNKLPVYKGILTVVDENYRGNSLHLALQSFLFSYIPHKLFYIDNTTQLTNIAVITNHIKSQRKLEKISLTFFRKNIF